MSMSKRRTSSVGSKARLSACHLSASGPASSSLAAAAAVSDECTVVLSQLVDKVLSPVHVPV